ncbi:uncharacterized protein Gasu_66210 [Galdieria sulphuraria]|uniref:Uncharacterized protein n=1 Tax=Galdieria sulphuraria TaxID=130081 RepID=M2XQJ4_GALSU|nr:uncharacterized protein Gasu_66210 [Galdieria sulphuraria]EME25719.1 hypothetical protein Gasu_66210 [Galdieria sulphuraria]|eukprot:XP_005702239.1 hypothetical protein Gasu_66210 [Galdieria sulphuraria]
MYVFVHRQKKSNLWSVFCCSLVLSILSNSRDYSLSLFCTERKAIVLTQKANRIVSIETGKRPFYTLCEAVFQGFERLTKEDSEIENESKPGDSKTRF